MNLADLDSCDDIAALRQTAKSSLLERDATITRHEQELQYRQTRIDALLFELARLKRWRFGAQSAQLTAAQRQLFEDALAEDIQTLEQALEAEHPAPSAAFEPRALTPKRQVLPAHLPRIEHRYERVDCQCEVCQQPLTVIGEEVSEQLDCEPIRRLSIVNADLKLTHFCSERRFKSDTPPLHLPTAYAAGAVSRLLFTMPAAR